ncbi:hypothetical protein Hypma_005432 [Hypsizygus marmoreus]|uniref:Uncharacterized protein n=1 Tax=Hypsizygus marmoreus TaxID=39966 RepID=A0A369J1N6_HYPMA|nr:hypothetical protein Hypma_005432 [Hypsizygus marmoreus]
MPRPQLYHTPEEKQAANRAKSNRHYAQNKASIRAKRSTNYRAQSKHIPRTKRDGEIPRSDRLSSKPLDSGLSYCGNASTYINTIAEKYLLNHSKDDIRDTILYFTPLQKSINRYHDEILQLAGMGKEMARVDEVSKVVRVFVNSLEDLLCTAMLGYDDFVSLHSKRGLMYQSM